MRILIFLILIINCLLCCLPVPANSQSLQGTIDLVNGPVNCRVNYQSGYAEWAANILRLTRQFLQAAEIYLGIPFPWQADFHIDGRDEVVLLAEGINLNGVKVGGYNLGKEVALEYGISGIGNPALLYHELGRVQYRGLLKEYAQGHAGWSVPEVLQALGKFKKTGWQQWLTGWVFPGQYPVIAYQDFRDDDHDLLLSAEEYFLGTDPGRVDSDGDLIPDGLETAWGLDPLVREKPAAVQQLIEDRGPFIDGMPADWEQLPAIISTDKAGDGTKAGYDFIKLSVTLRNGYLYLFAATKAPPPVQPVTMFDVLVDENSDRNPEREFAFNPEDPFGSWTYEYATASSRQVAGLQGTFNHGFEMAIPLAALTQREFQILPILRQWEKQLNYDEWDNWVCINLAELEGVAKYRLRTDLKLADADNDGIPDVVELHQGLNPLVRDPPDVMFDVLVDTDLDNRSDHDFAFMLTAAGNPWHYSLAAGVSGFPPGLAGGMGEVFELAIPLAVLPPGACQVLPILRDNGKQVNYDEWDSWVRVIK